MGKTSIEWTDASWNPIVGCTEISPGCANCYAARLAATRLRHVPEYDGLAVFGNSTRWTSEVRLHPERIEEPLNWRKPRKIFVCDMGDLFHEKVLRDWIVRVFAVMAACPQHTFQVLTKRAARMNLLIAGAQAKFAERVELSGDAIATEKGWCHAHQGEHWPLPNVWLGVSVENQHFADQRIPLLLQTPAAVRWISCEPLLGPVDLRAPTEMVRPWLDKQLDWVVCGGESGPNARPMHPDWARQLRDQCASSATPFFFKQWGEWAPQGQIDSSRTFVGHNLGEGHMMLRYGKKLAGRLLDGRTWDEFPSPQVTP